MSYIQRVNDWCLRNDIWYIQMDLEVPSACIDEAHQLHEAGFFVQHRCDIGRARRASRAKAHGWEACALHGWVEHGDVRDGWRNTDPPRGDCVWGWTAAKDLAPETTRWLSELPGFHPACRARFMLLNPGGWIAEHADYTDRHLLDTDHEQRMNIAFNHPAKDCHLLRTDTNEILPHKPLTGYFFDAGVPHKVWNHSDELRFHFLVSGLTDDRSEALIQASILKQFGSDAHREISLSS